MIASAAPWRDISAAEAAQKYQAGYTPRVDSLQPGVEHTIAPEAARLGLQVCSWRCAEEEWQQSREYLVHPGSYSRALPMPSLTKSGNLEAGSFAGTIGSFQHCQQNPLARAVSV
jgi:hypothetical protein